MLCRGREQGVPGPHSITAPALRSTPKPLSSPPIPLVVYSHGDKANPDVLLLPLPSPSPPIFHPSFARLPPTFHAAAAVGAGWWQGCTGAGRQGPRGSERQERHRRDAPSTSNSMHTARRSGAEKRTENAERNSGPFPFVRVRWEQKGDASDPHAAESQPRLTPTTWPDPTTKPRASRCPPATWHPCGVRGPRPDGPAGRQPLPGLSPCLPSPSPLRHALSPGQRFTIYPAPLVLSTGL